MTRDVNKRALVVLLAIGFLWFIAHAGSLLVVDKQESSDLIVVLAGETNYRLARALQLLNQGYAHRVLLDVPANSQVFGTAEIELAKKYVSGLPEAGQISICPIRRAFDESRIARCRKVPRQRAGLEDPDRHFRLSHPAGPQHPQA